MSAPAPAPRRAAPGASLAASLALFIAFALIAFLSTGGSDLGANTWQEIVLVGVGAGAGCALLLFRAPGGRWGSLSFVLFAALAALTALSLAWSVTPDVSWVEAGRTLSYLCVFGTAIALARLVPTGWGSIVAAVAAYATLISAYALLVKVFPATFDPTGFIGRLSAPFDYWNATGVVAAMGLPAALWLGSRRERAGLGRSLAVPAVALEVAVIVLSYSRSAVLAAVLALAVWFLWVPLRLRSAAALGLGGAGGAVISAWALLTHPLTHDKIALAARVSAGHGFGILLLVVLVLSTVAGQAGAFAADRVVLSPGVRRRIGLGLIGLVGLIPLSGIVALAGSSRGFGGEASHIWSSLTSTSGHVSDNPGRLVELGSTRPQYWSEGIKVGEHALLKGTGALGYATARMRFTTSPRVVDHAHSYLVETFADFGLIGLAVSLALLIAWALAVRTTLWPRPSGPPGVRPEHHGLIALLAVVIAFGAQSTIDWTWFVPGVAVPALFCAGWLAGRGRPAPEAPLHRLHPLDHPLRTLNATGLVVVGLLAAWAIWQPLRAQQSEAAATTAAATGDSGAAITDARTAAAENPLAVEPMFELAALYDAAGLQHLAHSELRSALALQPQNPQSWLTAGLYDLQHGHRRASIGLLRHALALAPSSATAQQAIAQAETVGTARPPSHAAGASAF